MICDPKGFSNLNYAKMYETNPDLVRTLVGRALNERLVQVRFKKVNGEFRDMLCTTCTDWIPPKEVFESNVPKIIRKENLDVCRVFDVNKKEWRSFRYDHLISVDHNDGEKIYLSADVTLEVDTMLNHQSSKLLTK